MLMSGFGAVVWPCGLAPFGIDGHTWAFESLASQKKACSDTMPQRSAARGILMAGLTPLRDTNQ